MPNRFPPLAAPAPLTHVRRRPQVKALPRWMHSLPLTELLVMGTIALALIFA